MKKLILILILLITTISYAQKPKVDGVGYSESSATIKAALVTIDNNRRWQVFDEINQRWEYWDGDSWEALGGSGSGYLSQADIDTFAELNAIVADEELAKQGDNLSVFTNDLDADDIDDASTTNKFVTAAQKTLISSALQSGDDISELTNDSGYITSANISGLEAIDEGNGIGWRLIGRDVLNYGNIGVYAIDLSFSATPSLTRGATGAYSSTLGGIDNTSSGAYSIVSGGLSNIAEGTYSSISGGLNNNITNTGTYSSIAGGYNNLASNTYSLVSGGIDNSSTGVHSAILNGSINLASGIFSTVINGTRQTAFSAFETVMGHYATEYTPNDAGSIDLADRLVTVGNGIDEDNRSDALIILKSGLITAPSLTNAMIDTSATGKEVITVDWFNENNGSGTASGLTITDSGALITATDVEGALAENRTAINLNTAKTSFPGFTDLETDYSVTIPTDIDLTYSTMSYASTINEAHDSAAPNRSLSLSGDATVTITGIENGDTGRWKIRGTGTITLNNTSAASLVFYIDDEESEFEYTVGTGDILLWKRFVSNPAKLIDIPTAPDPTFEIITYTATMSEAHNSARPKKYINATADLDLTITGAANGQSGIVDILAADGAEINLFGIDTISFTGQDKLVHAYYISDKDDNIKWRTAEPTIKEITSSVNDTINLNHSDYFYYTPTSADTLDLYATTNKTVHFTIEQGATPYAILFAKDVDVYDLYGAGDSYGIGDAANEVTKFDLEYLNGVYSIRNNMVRTATVAGTLLSEPAGEIDLTGLTYITSGTGGSPEGNSFDDDINTYSSTLLAQSGWVGFDYGSDVTISEIRLLPRQTGDANSERINDTQLQWSSDNSTWNNIGTSVSGVDGATNYTNYVVITFTAQTARYWRWINTSTGTYSGNIAECKAFN